jgi:hypothetical protein
MLGKAITVAGVWNSENLCTIGTSRWQVSQPYPPAVFTLHFCYSHPQVHSAVGMIKSMENSNDLIGNRIRYFPACSAVP